MLMRAKAILAGKCFQGGLKLSIVVEREDRNNNKELTGLP